MSVDFADLVAGPNPANAPAVPFDQPSAFEQGLRSGTSSALGQLNAAAGAVAEPFGATDFARERYAKAKELEAEAASEAPPDGSYHDVHDLRSGFNYVTGTLGKSVPAMAGALGAMALTRGRMPLTAATAATAPLEVGGAVEAQQNDPVAAAQSPGKRLVTALATGVPAAAIQNVLPASVASKVAGKGLITAAKAGMGETLATNVLEGAGTQAAAGAGSEAVRQAGASALNPDRDTSGDTEALKEAAVGGAAVGAPLGAAGAAGEIAHSRAGAYKSLFNREGTQDEATARAVANDMPIDPVPPGADPAAHVAQSDAKATQWATDKLKGWLADANLTPDAKAKFEGLLDQVAEPTARTEVATTDLAMGAAKQVGDFYDHMAKMVKPAGTDEAKQSADYSGARAVITQEMLPAIQKMKPELMSDPDAVDRAADAIRMYVQMARDGDKPENDQVATGYLRSILGPDAPTVLERAISALHDDEQGSESRENTYATLAKLSHDDATQGGLEGVVRSSLDKPEQATHSDVREAVRAMKSYADGSMFEGVGPQERAYREGRFRDEINRAFGKNADKVLKAFDEHREANKSETKLDTEDDLDKGPGAKAETLNESDEAQEKPRYYGSKDKGLIMSHEAHARTYGNQDSPASKLMERATKENPDRNVSFMKAKDFARERGITDDQLHEMTGGKPEDYGVVAAEGLKQQGRITEDEARGMLLDSKTHANSKSRIDTDKPGVTLDAYKITSHAMKTLPYLDGESNVRRTARAFKEGLASALIHYDAKLKGELPGKLVVASRNGVKLTLDDMKSARMRDPLMDTRDLDSDILDTKRLIAKAVKAGDEAKVKELRDELKNLRGRVAGRDRGEGTTQSVKDENGKVVAEMRNTDISVDLAKLHSDMGLEEIGKDAQIHAAAKEHGEGTDLQVKHAVSEASASTKRMADAAAKPADVSVHVPAREPTIKDDAKDVIAGSSTQEGVVARAIKGGPSHMKALINAINDTKVKNARELRNANDGVYKLNEALGDVLKKSPDAAYALEVKKLDAQGVDPLHDTGATARAHVEELIKGVLGDKVSVAWAKIMHAGEFLHTKGKGKIDPTYAIRLSVHALDPEGAGHHEALHAFFAMLRDQGNHAVMKVLYKAADAAPVLNQLKRLLKDEPEALKQLMNNKEERVAYMYQFYAKNKLNLGTDTRNIFGRIKDFILHTLGIWTNDQRAMHIMDYFHQGKFVEHIGDRNAVSRALLEPGRNRAHEFVKAALMPLKNLEQKVLGTGAERMRNTRNPALQKLADLIQPESTGETRDVGFIQSARDERTQRLNTLARGVKGLSEDDLEAAHEALKRGEAGDTPAVKSAVKAVRATLDNMFEYMRASGVRIGDLGYKNDYFPRVWDAAFISKHQDEFRQMLGKYQAQGKFVGNIDRVMSQLMARDGSEKGVVVDMPGMQHAKERVLNFIEDKDAAPFLQKSLFSTLNSYITQGTRRAEWARRFGDDGKGMRALLDEAKKEHGATDEEMDMAQDYIRGIDGTLGDDINPTARRLFGNMMVYQNVRLLPLAIFSSLVDPGGILVRGGTLGDAFNAFKRGIGEIPRGFKKNPKSDEAYRFAQDVGAIEDTTLVHTLGSAYTQGMVAEGARKLNDTFFKLNLMEQFNTSMRVSATEAAVRFIARHAELPNQHSERWLAELGLKPSIKQYIKNGRPLVFASEFEAVGMKPDEAAAASNRMRGAINRWVDGAILRPNAADKPIWMNDPHYSLIAHLKQFTYAFQNTILKRVWHEAEYGNYGPALALGSYVPVMIAADLAKGMIQGGGQQPDWKKDWGVGDYLYSGVQRAGLMGVSQYSSDFVTDIKQGGAGFGRVMGPTYEQLSEGIKTLAGREMFKTMAMHSMPANALYSHAFKAPASDPNFSE